MATYNFHLQNKLPFGSIIDFWGEGTMYMLGLEMAALFDKVCASPLSKKYKQSDYWWNSNPGAIAGHELLCYFVASPLQSITGANPADQMQTGHTIWDANGGISEVFVANAVALANGDPIKGVANVAFHELMHNKLRKGNSMHSQKGIASEVISANSKLNATNISSMAAALPTLRTQNKSFM